jgi:triacylglycerol esterase/lipase EstA (alpha/beta hydrolase family)
LAIELIGIFAAARLLGAGIACAAAVSILILIALHTALILLTFAIARPRASPRTMAAECAAFFALFALIQPFHRLFMAAAGQSPLLENTTPVLLVHGYTCNRGLWWWMLRKLRWHGFRAGAVSLEPPFASIDALAEQLHRDIEDFLRDNASDRLTLVTHSMGGLTARAYLKQHGGARVAKLVTLACPHHGTRLATLAPGRNAREMEPCSAWLAALAEGEVIEAPFLNVWSLHDNFVAPQRSGSMEGGQEIALDGLGHLSLAFSRRVLKILLRELA